MATQVIEFINYLVAFATYISAASLEEKCALIRTTANRFTSIVPLFTIHNHEATSLAGGVVGRGAVCSAGSSSVFILF